MPQAIVPNKQASCLHVCANGRPALSSFVLFQNPIFIICLKIWYSGSVKYVNEEQSYTKGQVGTGPSLHAAILLYDDCEHDLLKTEGGYNTCYFG